MMMQWSWGSPRSSWMNVLHTASTKLCCTPIEGDEVSVAMFSEVEANLSDCDGTVFEGLHLRLRGSIVKLFLTLFSSLC